MVLEEAVFMCAHSPSTPLPLPSPLQDVSPLFSLPLLEELSFSDPAHGPNPFSSLCNYSTHLLYHLPQLKRLDGRDVTHPHLRNVIQVRQGGVLLCKEGGLWLLSPLVPKSRVSRSFVKGLCRLLCSSQQRSSG